MNRSFIRDLFLSFLAPILYPLSADAATTLFVPSDFDTIGEAIESAQGGDEIMVSAGVYRESITIDRNIKLISASGPGETFLMGSGGKFTVKITTDGEISGFTITGSEAGVMVATEGGDVIIYNCTIGRNAKYGILVEDYSQVDIDENNIVENGFWGIYAEESSTVDIYNNIISANEDTGVELYYSNGDIRNNILSRNLFVGIRISGEYKPKIVNNTLARNTYTGIFLLEDAYPRIKNNIVVESDYGIYSISADPEEVDYNDVWNNGTASYYGMDEPEQNISDDPIFVYYHETIEYFEEDFHLSTGSPCIDAGDPSIAYNDLDGTRNDIGAYGGPFLASTIGSGFNPRSDEEWLIGSEEEDGGPCGNCVYSGRAGDGPLPILFLILIVPLFIIASRD